MRDNAVRVETLVRVDKNLAEIQTIGGKLMPADRLGTGVVKELGPRGEVKVHWVDANLDAWVLQSDLLQFEDGTRLISVRTYNRFGHARSSRSQVVRGIGLRYNWSVELRPRDIVRVTCPDGQIWTFKWFPLFREAHPIHTMLMDGYELNDDQAEALTVAEIAAGSK